MFLEYGGMTMDTKEEVIEEISDINVVDDKKDEQNIVDDKSNTSENLSEVTNNNEVLETSATEEVVENKEDANKEVIEVPKKRKVFLIVLLSIFLLLDIAALVIYIVGIDKVLGFIK